MDIKAIKEFYNKLRKDRIVLTYGEFSEKLRYHRTYISRVLNGHEPLTPDIVKRIKETDFYVTNNVPRETLDTEDFIKEVTRSFPGLVTLLNKQHDTIDRLIEKVPKAPDINETSKNGQPSKQSKTINRLK